MTVSLSFISICYPDAGFPIVTTLKYSYMSAPVCTFHQTVGPALFLHLNTHQKMLNFVFWINLPTEVRRRCGAQNVAGRKDEDSQGEGGAVEEQRQRRGEWFDPVHSGWTHGQERWLFTVLLLAWISSSFPIGTSHPPLHTEAERLYLITQSTLVWIGDFQTDGSMHLL